MFTKLVEYFKARKAKSRKKFLLKKQKKQESSPTLKTIIPTPDVSVTQIPTPSASSTPSRPTPYESFTQRPISDSSVTQKPISGGLSVTQRIKDVQQPVGVYLNPQKFKTINIYSDDFWSPEFKNENIQTHLVGLAVDYLTRVLLTNKPLEAFSVSIKGAKLIEEGAQAQKKAASIVDLSPSSITSACQLSGYDVCVCQGIPYYKPVQEILPNNSTIANIELMVKRSIQFFKKYGPVVECGFSVDGKRYAKHVTAGSGDFLTSDTIWDFKSSINQPTSKHTLQLLMYYLMGKHSSNKNLQNIQKLGIFNPRLNKIYILNVSDIPDYTIEAVEKEVIGY